MPSASALPVPAPLRPLVLEALRLLGVDQLVLAIHDPSFPSAPDEDVGRGSPYSSGGRDFLDFVASLGFTGVQLGPQGQTTAKNPSPYDGTLFSRNALGVDLWALVEDPAWGGLLDRATLARVVAGNPRPDGSRAAHRHAWDGVNAALDAAFDAFEARRGALPGLARDFQRFLDRNRTWLDRDGLFEVLALEHGTDKWWTWPSALDRSLPLAAPEEAADRLAALRGQGGRTLRRYAFGQWVVHRQHAALRERLGALGLTLLGDLQVGLSRRDTWSLQGVLLKEWRLGAPPSRTNPEGQPWGYHLLDPDQVVGPDGRAGPALELFRARVDKMLGEYDGLRIDHPHGLVDPWVYRETADGDRHAAVRAGGRLFSSPEHPELAGRAVVRPDQVDHEEAPHADDRVGGLDEAQVDRYGVLFEALADAAEAHGRQRRDLLCEVLSTCPHPLARVMQRYGLGRFRVTQKAKLDDPANVYRSENARPEDWIMAGNHDTWPLARVVDGWMERGEAPARARYLAGRLSGDPALARRLAEDPRALFHAQVADLLASPARHAMVFFADLFGMREVYNAPGTISEDNWSLRVPRDYEARFAEDAARGEALDLPRALVLALRARGLDRTHPELTAQLQSASGPWWGRDD